MKINEIIPIDEAFTGQVSPVAGRRPKTKAVKKVEELVGEGIVGDTIAGTVVAFGLSLALLQVFVHSGAAYNLGNSMVSYDPNTAIAARMNATMDHTAHVYPALIMNTTREKAIQKILNDTTKLTGTIYEQREAGVSRIQVLNNIKDIKGMSSEVFDAMKWVVDFVFAKEAGIMTKEEFTQRVRNSFAGEISDTIGRQEQVRDYEASKHK